MDINVPREVEDLIKKRITQLRLVDTGDLLKSIKVTYINGQININALEYFKYLDKRYDIMGYVIKSTEFQRIIAQNAKEEILKELRGL